MAASAYLWWESRRLYFFGDDWAFLLGRHLSWSDLMRPHNEHWSTLPVLAFVAMRRVVGINHYPAYALMPLVLHAACCTLLYRLMRRHQVPAWPAVALLIPFGFLAGNVSENPMWDFQIGFLGSATLGLVALHVHTGRQSPPVVGYAAGWTVSVLALMCSGMGNMMLIWLGAYVLLRRGLVGALAAVVPPGVVYVVWYLAYGRHEVTPVPSPTADQVVDFTATGIGTIWQQFVRIPQSGGLIVLLLLLFTLMVPLAAPVRALLRSGLLTAGVVYLLLGFSRGGLGPDASTAGRYIYFGLLFTLPCAATALGWLGSRMIGGRRERAILLGVLTLVLAANGAAQTAAFVDGRSGTDPDLRNRIAAAEELIEHHGRFLSAGVSLTYNPDITPARLKEPSIRSRIPARQVSDQELLDTSALLQAASSATSFRLVQPRALGTHDLTGAVVLSSCNTVKAGPSSWIDLPPSTRGSQVRLVTRASSLSAQLVSGDLVSQPLALTATPGGSTFVATTSTLATLRINLPRGHLQLCLGA